MNDAFEMIHSLVDGELSHEQRESVLLAISKDPQLSRDFAWAQAVKEVVRTKCPRQVAGADWESARRRIKELDKVKTTNHLVTKYAWAMSGVLFLGILAAGVLTRKNPSLMLNPGGYSSIIDSPINLGNQHSVAVPPTPGQSWVVFDDVPPLKLTHGEAVISIVHGDISSKAAAEVRMIDRNGPILVYYIRNADQYPGVDQPYPYGNMKLGFVSEHSALSFKQGDYLVVLAADRPIERLIEVARQIG